MSLDQLLATTLAEFPSSGCATLEEVVKRRVELLDLHYRAKMLELEDDPQLVAQETAQLLQTWQQLQQYIGNERYPALYYDPHASFVRRKQQLIALDQQLGTKSALKLLKSLDYFRTKGDIKWLKTFPAHKRAYDPRAKWKLRKEQLELMHNQLGLRGALQFVDDLWLEGKASGAVRTQDRDWLVWWGGTPVIHDDTLHWEI